jgi:hypothetical protein
MVVLEKLSPEEIKRLTNKSILEKKMIFLKTVQQNKFKKQFKLMILID